MAWRGLLRGSPRWRAARVAGSTLAQLACLQSFESTECGYSEISAGVSAVENRFVRINTKGDGSRIDKLPASMQTLDEEQPVVNDLRLLFPDRGTDYTIVCPLEIYFNTTRERTERSEPVHAQSL
jgi:hypothetical protein